VSGGVNPVEAELDDTPRRRIPSGAKMRTTCCRHEEEVREERPSRATKCKREKKIVKL
jgi:hypothetical protein